MSNKLFVGGISWNTDEESLKAFFSVTPEGKELKVVSAKIITDRETGRSKGFGFVEYETEEDAKEAQMMFDGKELDGRTLRVDFAQPQQDRGDRGSSRPSFRRDDRSRDDSQYAA